MRYGTFFVGLKFKNRPIFAHRRCRPIFMNNTWVKLYRKINSSTIMRDATALQLFIWIMTNVDRHTGEVTFGRYIVGKELRTNPNTLYSALKRLVSKYKVVTISSTTEYTTIRLIHWAKYQSGEELINTNDTSPSPTTHQPVTTIQEVENREYINNNEKNPKDFSELKETLGIKEPTNGGITQEFQNQAMQLIDALNVPFNRKGAYFSAVQKYPRGMVLKAYAFAIDHPNVGARDKMFFWKLNELNKNATAK